MTDATGNVAQEISYDEYGNLSSGSTATGESFRFTGRRYDSETGLYYYRARYYSPTLGRFLQTDPIGYQDDINAYTYVGNDPLDKTDFGGTASSSCAQFLDRNPSGGCWEVDDTGSNEYRYTKSLTAAGAVAGAGAVAIASIPADAASFGLNIPATPAELVAGAAAGGAAGWALGRVADKTAALFDKLADELSGIAARIAGPDAEQYSLRAADSGLYPDVRAGTKHSQCRRCLEVWSNDGPCWALFATRTAPLGFGVYDRVSRHSTGGVNDGKNSNFIATFSCMVSSHPAIPFSANLHSWKSAYPWKSTAS